MSQNSVALSDANLSVCGKGTDLLQSVFARLSLPEPLVPSSYRQSGSVVKQDPLPPSVFTLSTQRLAVAYIDIR